MPSQIPSIENILLMYRTLSTHLRIISYASYGAERDATHCRNRVDGRLKGNIPRTIPHGEKHQQGTRGNRESWRRRR